MKNYNTFYPVLTNFNDIIQSFYDYDHNGQRVYKRVEDTISVFQGDIKNVVNGVQASYNTVKNIVTNGANSLKQGTSNLFRRIKSVFSKN